MELTSKNIFSILLIGFSLYQCIDVEIKTVYIYRLLLLLLFFIIVKQKVNNNLYSLLLSNILILILKHFKKKEKFTVKNENEEIIEILEKRKQTMKNLDELLDYIKDYYNNKLAETNEGYFPGQGKPDDQVGGYSDLETASNEINIKIEDNIKFEDEELYKENVSEEELILKKLLTFFLTNGLILLDQNGYLFLTISQIDHF